MYLRRGEIARLHTSDVIQGLSGWRLRVHGKGGRVRVIPLDDDLAVELRVLPKGWVFPGRVDGHLSAATVGVLVSRALPDDWSAHPLRHRFATRAYAGTHDLLAVQELLGHARPETTRIYIAVEDSALRLALRAAA